MDSAVRDVRAAPDESVRERLVPLLPAKGSVAPWTGLSEIDAGRIYLELLAPGGWAVPTWPQRYHGCDASPEESSTIATALAEREAPSLYLFAAGLRLVGPLLLSFGTNDQQSRWLPDIALGRTIWCQMFSEPDAGSDLASLTTRARPAGTDWVLTGQKVWTSRGKWAQLGLCLARTDPAAPKRSGLTMFAVDLASEGCTVRPLRQMNGDDHFSEVFLDGVRLSDSNRIGSTGEGWSLARYVLRLERSGMGDRGAVRSRPTQLARWVATAAERGYLDDPVLRDAAMRAWILDVVAQLSSRRSAVDPTTPSLRGPGAKLRAVSAYRARTALRSSLAGAAGVLDGWDGCDEFLTAPSVSIRGGTNEIQLNLLAERELGLPAEDRVEGLVR